MYGIFTEPSLLTVYLPTFYQTFTIKNNQNVGKYTSPMDDIGSPLIKPKTALFRSLGFPSRCWPGIWEDSEHGMNQVPGGATKDDDIASRAGMVETRASRSGWHGYQSS